MQLFKSYIYLFKDANSAKTFNEDAGAMYERAVGGVLNKNMLLYFTYADFEEGRMKYEKVHTVYQKLLDIEDIDPTLVRSIPICWFAICPLNNCLLILRMYIKLNFNHAGNNGKIRAQLNEKYFSEHLKIPFNTKYIKKPFRDTRTLSAFFCLLFWKFVELRT